MIDYIENIFGTLLNLVLVYIGYFLIKYYIRLYIQNLDWSNIEDYRILEYNSENGYNSPCTKTIHIINFHYGYYRMIVNKNKKGERVIFVSITDISFIDNIKILYFFIFKRYNNKNFKNINISKRTLFFIDIESCKLEK